MTNLEDLNLLHLLSSREAAFRLRLSPNSLRVYAVKYGLGKKLSGRWLFSTAEIEMLGMRPGRGRPKRRKG